MKQLKQLVIRCCVAIGIAIICGSSVQAQSVGGIEATGIKAGAPMLGAEIHLGSGAAASVTNSGTQPGKSLFSPLDAVPFQLSYCDSTLPITDMVGGQLIIPYLILMLGERFTLPASGFVDSVTLQIDTISSAGAVTVSLISDTLINIGGAGAYYHIMNLAGIQYLSDLNQIGYAVQTVTFDNVHSGVPTTVYFPHVAVPQSFFVAVTPEINGSQQVAEAFLWRGDQEALRARTPDNCRSALVVENILTQQIYSLVLDSTLRINGGNLLITNFYATLYGSAGPAGVPIQLSSVHEDALYPNPATTVLNIPASLHASDFELRDILGRTVLHSSERNPAFVDVHSLASGSYLAFIHTAAGVITTPVVIAR